MTPLMAPEAALAQRLQSAEAVRGGPYSRLLSSTLSIRGRHRGYARERRLRHVILIV